MMNLVFVIRRFGFFICIIVSVRKIFRCKTFRIWYNKKVGCLDERLRSADERRKI